MTLFYPVIPVLVEIDRSVLSLNSIKTPARIFVRVNLFKLELPPFFLQAGHRAIGL